VSRKGTAAGREEGHSSRERKGTAARVRGRVQQQGEKGYSSRERGTAARVRGRVQQQGEKGYSSSGEQEGHSSRERRGTAARVRGPTKIKAAFGNVHYR